jgi:hypothetical protein
MLSHICFTFNYHFCKMICHIEVLHLLTHGLFYENCSPIIVEIKLLLLHGMCLYLVINASSYIQDLMYD